MSKKNVNEDARRPLPVNVQEKLFLEKLARRRKGEAINLRASDEKQLRVYYAMLFIVLTLILSYAAFIMIFGQAAEMGGVL